MKGRFQLMPFAARLPRFRKAVAFKVSSRAVLSGNPGIPHSSRTLRMGWNGADLDSQSRRHPEPRAQFRYRLKTGIRSLRLVHIHIDCSAPSQRVTSNPPY